MITKPPNSSSSAEWLYKCLTKVYDNMITGATVVTWCVLPWIPFNTTHLRMSSIIKTMLKITLSCSLKTIFYFLKLSYVLFSYSTNLEAFIYSEYPFTLNDFYHREVTCFKSFNYENFRFMGNFLQNVNWIFVASMRGYRFVVIFMAYEFN